MDTKEFNEKTNVLFMHLHRREGEILLEHVQSKDVFERALLKAKAEGFREAMELVKKCGFAPSWFFLKEK